MILLHGIELAVAGIVVGLVLAVALGRVMSSLLFGISPNRPRGRRRRVQLDGRSRVARQLPPARRAETIDPTATMKAE
jgi:hypothetical protein